jgi:heptaprenyl diphosphate synthase
MKTRTITLFALLTAAALVLGWIDRMIPLPPVPGIRLGLANITLLYALYMADRKSAALLMLLKVLLSALLFGSPLWTMLVSLAGGVMSLGAMALTKSIPRANIILVSTMGALFHVVGQIAVILLARMAPMAFVWGYLPLLGLLSIGTGVLTGIVAKYALKALKYYQDADRKPAK